MAAAVVALAPDPRSALPGLTYYFRDFTVTFYPQWLFAAREMAAGRWPAWNPFVNEGTFVLPMLYPTELLHVLWPGPAAVSWLLTLHLPIAALASFALARDRGTSRAGAFVAGAVFSLGGLTLSSLNLHVFLQALALGPLTALALRRAALFGGGWVAAAAMAVGLSTLTLALEFVAQGIALGLVLAWAERPGGVALQRLGAALALGFGVAAVPVATIGAILLETPRGTGFDRSTVGEPAGLASALLSVPAVSWFRFPSKALLFPFVSLALLAGMGLQRLMDGRCWRMMGAFGLAFFVLGAGVWAGAASMSEWVVGQRGATVPLQVVTRVIAADGLDLARSGAIAAAAALVALRVPEWRVHAAVMVAALALFDLVAAARGVNPQAPAAMFRPLPEIAALRLHALDGGRVFSYGLDVSPAFGRLLSGSGSRRELWMAFLTRQVLAPYANMIDRVELAQGKDPTSFVPNPPSIGHPDLDPADVAKILPKLRQAGVTRVIGLDPLAHQDLTLLVKAPAGPPDMHVFVYALSGAAPRLRLACPGAAPCGAARLGPAQSVSGQTIVEVEGEAETRLVVRDAYARGWVAEIDGQRVTVQRAEGPYMAVPVPPGAHRVSLQYRPPGLRAGALVMVASLAAITFVAVYPRWLS